MAKREAFRARFAGFDVQAVAAFDEETVAELLTDPGIIRHRGKIEATIGNARATLALREDASLRIPNPVRARAAEAVVNESTNTGPDDTRAKATGVNDSTGPEVLTGLPALLWSHRPAGTPCPATVADVPTTSAESVSLSKELKRRGFRFVGPTTVYALMEAVGMVDTHLIGSHRRGVGSWQDAE